MRTTSSELTRAERAYRLIAQGIPPLLASGQVSRSSGLLLAGVFLLSLLLAVASSYVTQRQRYAASMAP